MSLYHLHHPTLHLKRYQFHSMLSRDGLHHLGEREYVECRDLEEEWWRREEVVWRVGGRKRKRKRKRDRKKRKLKKKKGEMKKDR